MNRVLNFNEDNCLRARDNHKGTVHSLANVVFLFPVASHLQGVLHSSSRPDYIEDKKSGGQQQSNLFPVSASSDVRMSTLRPNPYLSIGIEKRRSKKRGFLQLFSRPI